MLLGDQPVRHFLADYDARWKKLADFQSYGELHPITLGGRNVHVLPLAHPRQVSALGTHSETWRRRHVMWKTKTAPTLL